MKTEHRSLRVVVIAFAAMIVWSIWWWKTGPGALAHLREYEKTYESFLVFSKKHLNRSVVEVKIVDMAGNPVLGATVRIENNSGWNGGLSDKDGRATINVGEPDILSITVNGKVVSNRPYAKELGYPSVGDGLGILVIFKQH